MADVSAPINSEHPSPERPRARSTEKPRIFKAIQQTYHDAQDHMRQALTLPNNYSFDLTEFNGKMDALKAKQHELDATTQAQLEQFAATNPKDMLDTSSVDKTKIREQLDEVEKVKKLRLQLGLPEVSPLLPTPESIAEKKRVVDEYLENKLKEKLEGDNPYSSRDSGFIDRSKEFIKNVRDERSERSISKGEKIKRAGAIKVFEAKGIANAQEIIDFTGAYMLDVKALGALSTNLKDVTLEELKVGRDRMNTLGYDYDAHNLRSQEFIQLVKKLSTVDAQTMQKVANELNPYFFLDKSEWHTNNPDGKPTAELATLAEIATNGGLTPDQKQTLDNAQRLALLSSNNNVVIRKENGEATDASYTQKTITDILSHSFPNQDMQDLLTLCEDRASRILQTPEEKRRERYHQEFPEIPVDNLIKALNNRDVVPLDLAAALTRQGIDCRAVLYTGNSPADTQQTRESLYQIRDIMANPGKRDWSLVISELTNSNDIYPLRGKLYEQFYQQREIISQIATITHALPEDMQDYFHTIVKLDNYEGNLTPITPEKTINLMSKVKGLTDQYPPPDGISPIDLKYLKTLTQFTTSKQTGWHYYDQLNFDLLPLATYIAENKASIDTLYDDNMHMTNEMVQQVLNTNTLQKNEPIMKFVINRAFTHIDPLLLLPHMNLLDVSNRISFIDRIPDSIDIDTLPINADAKTLLQLVKNAPNYSLKHLYATYEGNISNLYQNDAPTEDMFQLIITQRNIKNIDALSTDLDTNPNLTPQTRLYLTTLHALQAEPLKEFLLAERDNFATYFQEGHPTPAFISKVIDMKDFVSLPPLLTNQVLEQLPGNTGEVLRYWKELSPTFQTTMSEKIPNFPYVTDQDFVKYKKTLELAVLVNQSPSREIQRLQVELIDQLLLSDNPEQLFAQVENIFIKNNLPLIGKVYRVFETIYDKRLDPMIDNNDKISPQLRESSHQERRRIIYDDLLGVNIDSGNPSLRKFMTILESGESLVQKAESEGVDNFSEAERKQFDYFLDKMDTIYATSLLGRRASRNQPHDPSLHDKTPAERLQQIRTNFRVQEGQTITTRLAEMFVKPLGYESTHQVREAMQQAKTSATERNKQFAMEMIAKHDGVVQVNAGDIFKGTDQMYLQNILENGSVAREYLGSDSGSDATPLDTDVSMILADDIQNGVRGALDVSPSKGYGNMALIVRDRGQFNNDSTNGPAYELFHTGVLGERHFGIRTGFASTEISAILDNGLTDRQRDNIYFTIARNGFYVPVTDTAGKITFTPEMYDEYRKIFDGVAEYDGAPLVVDRLPKGDIAPEVIEKTTASIQALVGTIKEEAVTVDESLDKIRAVIKEVLTANGVKLRDQYDTSIFGADFADTGSTGRHTNKPGDMDFDLSLLLDAKDIARMPEIAKELKEKLNAREDKSHEEAANEYTQIRAIGAQLEGSEPLDIDIGIGRRADAGIFASHDAINAKLNSIRETYGDETYYEVLANVVLAKQILKEGYAYKKLEDGGFGGIGTEDWILANHGNMLEAFKTFNDAAHDENGNVVSLDDFRTRYRIFNAGTNIKFQDNAENFVFTLKPEGYQNMVQTVGSYLKAA